jgi:hypothetical protein
MKRLSYRHVLEIIEGKPVDELILVGGQSLNAWAEAFGIADELSDGLYGVALSNDIDFLGMAPAAIAFADALGPQAKVKVTALDDHTPNTAVVIFDFEGEQNVIDFLHALQGFSLQDLQRVREWAAIPEISKVMNNKLRVMHPIHCLQSQLENVYGQALNRRASSDGERNANRVRLAHEAAKRTVARYLDDGDPGSAQHTVEYVYNLAVREPALRAMAEDGVFITDAIADDERLGDAFQEKRRPQLIKKIEIASAKYQRLLQRRAELTKTS